MSYLKTYIFGDSTNVGTMVDKGDRYLLTLQFEIQDTGNNVTYLARDKGLKVIKYGKGSINIDPDTSEYLVLPKEYNFEIADPDEELTALLYGENSSKVVKDFFVKFEVKYSGASDYVIKFSGYNVPIALENPPLDKIHNFTALPKTDVLNKTFLYPKNYKADKWDPGKPDKDNPPPNNPLSLNYTRPEGSYVKWDWIHLHELIEKIFKKVNENISVEIIQNWKFLGDTSPEYGSYNHIQNGDLSFNDLIADSNFIGSLFSGANHGIETLGELLAQLAFDYGCMAIIPTQDKAYFKEIFTFNPSNVQTLGNICEDSNNRKYKYSKIDYADITSILFKQNFGELNNYQEKKFNWQDRCFCPRELKDKVQGENGTDRKTISVIDTAATHFPVDASTFSNLKAAVTGDPSKYFSIFGVRVPGFDVSSYDNTVKALGPVVDEGGFIPLNYILAELLYSLRGKLYNSQVREIVVDGINYDFVKNFYLDSGEYAIVGMEEDYDSHLTKIEAVRIKDAKTIGTTGEETGTVVTPINSTVVNAYGAEAQLSFENVGGTPIPIAYMNAGDWLEGFYVDILTAFLANQFTNFRAYDGNETLLTLDRIQGKLTQVIVQQITKIKKYTTPDTIYMEITNGSVTPSQGTARILVRKLKKEAA